MEEALATLRHHIQASSKARTLLLALIFAPSFNSSSAPSCQPSYAALCRGVLPACEDPQPPINLLPQHRADVTGGFQTGPLINGVPCSHSHQFAKRRLNLAWGETTPGFHPRRAASSITQPQLALSTSTNTHSIAHCVATHASAFPMNRSPRANQRGTVVTPCWQSTTVVQPCFASNVGRGG